MPLGLFFYAVCARKSLILLLLFIYFLIESTIKTSGKTIEYSMSCLHGQDAKTTTLKPSRDINRPIGLIVIITVRIKTKLFAYKRQHRKWS